MTETLFIFAYDITSDRTRRRVSSLLEKVGVRVQESVFELRVSPSRATSIGKRLSLMIDEEDSVRVYPIPPGSIAGVKVYGTGLPPERGDFILA